MTFTNKETKIIRSIIIAFIPMVEEAVEAAFFNIEKNPDKYFRFVDLLHASKELLNKIDRTTEL